MSANTKWRVELLGGLRVGSGARWITHFRTRRAALLLARLALESAPVPRDELVEWLWPDSFKGGRNRLSGALSALRRELETPGDTAKLFAGNHDFVEVNPELVECDVREWEKLLKRVSAEPDDGKRAECLSSALALWRGPLWAGDDDQWFQAQAQRLNDLLCGAALSLSELNSMRAVEALHQALEVAPAREDVARALMNALMARSQVEDARRVWRALETTLRSEWNRSPAPETRALARRIVEAPAAPQKDGLPPSTTRFFGREGELEMLSTWLAPAPKTRLITISGGGGHGKTRLALEAARRNAGAFQGDVCFVSLAAQSDAAHVLETVGDALGAPRVSGQNFLERAALAIHKRHHVLLLLDNFEHLLPAAFDVEALLHACPGAVCLVTSRRLLDLAGEQSLVLSPFALPLKPDQTPNARVLEEWAHNPALRLFVDRARAASPSFRLHAGNAASVARLCCALGGVPLALELAAARCVALSPFQIEEHLQKRLDVLEGGRAIRGGRHGGLRAALDWSFELLSPAEQRLFLRLSVFHGSWTLARAVSVCAEDEAAVWKAHEELRRHSLLEPGGEDGHELRFRMGETVRLYARERASLEEDSAARERLEAEHAREFARLAQSAARAGRGHRSGKWARVLERELPDLRAALDWALEHDGPLALRLSASLWWFWFSTSRLDEGRANLKRALEQSEVEEDSPEANESGERINWRAEAQSGAGFLAWRQGDLPEATQLCFGACELARASGDEGALSYSLIVLQMAAIVSGDFEAAHAMGDECLHLARESGDQHAQAFALHLLGSGAEMTGDVGAAWSLQEQSAALFEATGVLEGAGWALFNAGSAARRVGQTARALELCARSRAIFEALSSREGLGYCDLYTAFCHREAGNIGDAAQLLRASLQSLFDLGALWGVAMALEGEAMTRFAGRDERAVEATRAWSAAQLLREQFGAPVPPVDRAAFADFERQLRQALPTPSFDAAWQTGRTFSLEQSVRAALKF